jgi:beta-glucosidase
MKYTLIFSLILLIMSCHNNTTRVSEQPDYEKSIDSLLQLMTLEEKIDMIHASSSFTSGGVERLGIPELVMSDGPHGVRLEHGRDWVPDDVDYDAATYLPTGICLAATWNKDLGYEYGSVLGSEANARGKDVILGPGVNIIRSPLCGRNFEYLSEDPYLTAQMAVGYIKGVQDQGVSACVKHYTANNQETNRAKVDVMMSERALREIYLPAFKASVTDADVNTIMGAYNKFRGQYSTHNEHLINDILKDEWEFDGVVISDWSAVKNTKEALLYGTDIEMGTELPMLPDADYNKFYLADSALAMIKRGEVDEVVVDDKVRRILRVMYKTDMFGNRKPGKFNTEEHQNIAQKVAEEGIVLLKNDNLLPINNKHEKTILVVGSNADRKHAIGGGSSQIKATYEITPLEGIKKYAAPNTKIKYVEGYTPSPNNKIDAKLKQEAISASENADMVIFIGGWVHSITDGSWDSPGYDMEGQDKTDLQLMFGQEELINDIAKVNPNLAVVIMGGSNVEMQNWMNSAKAILQAWYPGMEGGNALAAILFGKINPSGKLPMTFANSHLDYPAHKIGDFPGEDMRVEYKEGIYVGYRYFDKEKIEPVFPFGFGLSYTSFSFSDLNVRLAGDVVEVDCMIKNTGNMAGAEVAQLYIHPVSPSIDRPIRELSGFEKIYLNPTEQGKVRFELRKSDFGYFDENENSWKIEPGEYIIEVGNSSRNTKLSEKVTL